MSFAILRTAKLSSFGNVGGSASHNFRERNTPNADPERTSSNVTSGAQLAKEVIEAVRGRLETVPTVRKNAVLAIEYFIGASPEWFIEQSSQVREAYFDAAEKWLTERHGAENVIAFTRQYDETSPHVCAYVVPIDPKGKLNCSHFLDGRTKLSQMQSAFAEQVGQTFGLERGIEGSGAKHVTIKQYYAQIQAPTPELKTQIPPEPQSPTVGQRFAELMGVETEHSQAQAQRQAAFEQRNREIVAQRQAQQSKAQQYDFEKAANAARNARLTELRSTATQARQLPLESVLERLGCQREAKDLANRQVAFVESAIDAISLSKLGFKGKIVSLSGNSAALAKAKAEHYRSLGLTVVAAFDNDRAGDKMALHLGTPCERLKSQGKDWNDDLKRERATPQERLALDQAEQARQKTIKHQRSGPSLDR